MEYLKKQLKALQLCCSKDKESSTLNGILIEPIDVWTVMLIATNKRVFLHIKNVDYKELRCVLKEDYDITLLDVPEKTLLFLGSKKEAAHVVCEPVYPKYGNALPSVYSMGEYPAFGFDTMATVKKVYKVLAIEIDAYVPDKWGGLNATVKELNCNPNELLYVMPCRKGKT